MGPLKFELVAPMPEQLKNTTMHFYEASRNMCLLTLQGNALMWSQFVLGWVQRNSNFGSSDRTLYLLSHTLNTLSLSIRWRRQKMDITILADYPLQLPISRRILPLLVHDYCCIKLQNIIQLGINLCEPISGKPSRTVWHIQEKSCLKHTECFNDSK